LASDEAVDTYKAFVSLVFTIEELSYITIRLTYSELLALSLISRIQEYIPGSFGLYIGNVILFAIVSTIYNGFGLNSVVIFGSFMSWQGHFFNPIHEEGHFLANVLKYEARLSDPNNPNLHDYIFR
jgi:hypothetical protein